MKALCTLLHELKFQTIDFQWNQLYEKKNVTFQSHVHVFEEINLWSLYCNLSAYLIDTIKSVQSISDKEITYIDKCYNSYCIKVFFFT